MASGSYSPSDLHTHQRLQKSFDKKAFFFPGAGSVLSGSKAHLTSYVKRRSLGKP